jgi:hypothetical protein
MHQIRFHITPNICVIYALLVEFICYAFLYRSTKGVGATAPDYSKAQKLEDGLIVPLAKPKKNSGIKVKHYKFFSNKKKSGRSFFL